MFIFIVCTILTWVDDFFFVVTVFDWVERYAPGFKQSIVVKDILAPPDLEREFGLTGGVFPFYYY